MDFVLYVIQMAETITFPGHRGNRRSVVNSCPDQYSTSSSPNLHKRLTVAEWSSLQVRFTSNAPSTRFAD